MDEQKLTPATHEDLVQSLPFPLRYNRSGKRVSDTAASWHPTWLPNT